MVRFHIQSNKCSLKLNSMVGFLLQLVEQIYNRFSLLVVVALREMKMVMLILLLLILLLQNQFLIVECLQLAQLNIIVTLALLLLLNMVMLNWTILKPKNSLKVN